MSLLGEGVLAIWNGIAPGAEDEFLRWHVHEHIPERVALPGFLRGRRYVAVDGEPRFFNFYETNGVNDLTSPAYLAALDRPSEWTRSVVRSFRNTSRTVCRVALTTGRGEGVCVETVRMQTHLEAKAFRSRFVESLLLPVCREAGVVGVHLLEGQPVQATRQSEESRLRDRPDEVIGWALLIETVDAGITRQLRGELLHETRLAGGGVAMPIRRGMYSLQYSLAKTELAEPRDRCAPPA